MKLRMSSAGAALFRALLARCPADPTAIRLIDYRAQDWQSMTFSGERHLFTLRVTGEDQPLISFSLLHDLAEQEFDLPRHFVADIAGTAREVVNAEEVELRIEALTIATES